MAFISFLIIRTQRRDLWRLPAANDFGKIKEKVKRKLLFEVILIGFGVPGPGHYSRKSSNLHATGKYFISKMHNSGCSFFGKNKRDLTT